MIDLVKLLVRAGDGGHGRVAFRREKYVNKGGPNGGRGGDGGDIVVRASIHATTLAHLAGVQKIEAQDGQAGQKSQMSGKKGAPLVIEVPVGTIVWQLDSNEVAKNRLMPDGSLREPLKRRQVDFTRYEVEKDTARIPWREHDTLTQTDQGQKLLTSTLKNIPLDTLHKKKLAILKEHGQEIILAQGGFGGRGNEDFKGPARTTPLIAEYGTFGEERLVLFELQLLADIGLVGLPNAGKSTFLARTTNANPRVDSYPFTTLEPQLGVWSLTQGKVKQEIVLADIPGLIEGASKGHGLGYDFLRHIKACKALLFMLTFSDDIFGALQAQSLPVSDLITQLQAQYALLRTELSEFDATLLDKKQIVVVNKVDLLPPSVLQDLQDALRKRNINWLLISTQTGYSLKELEQLVMKSVTSVIRDRHLAD